MGLADSFDQWFMQDYWTGYMNDTKPTYGPQQGNNYGGSFAAMANYPSDSCFTNLTSVFYDGYGNITGGMLYDSGYVKTFVQNGVTKTYIWTGLDWSPAQNPQSQWDVMALERTAEFYRNPWGVGSSFAAFGGVTVASSSSSLAYLFSVLSSYAESAWISMLSGLGATINVVNQTGTAIFRNGYVEVNGFKISEYYYRRLFETGRPFPTLWAQQILMSWTSRVPDEVKEGFYKYIGLGWEMVYNPLTKEIWHIQPIK